MYRYDTYGPLDDAPRVLGDRAFVGVSMRMDPAQVAPGYISRGVNLRFRNGVAETRPGLTLLPWANRIVPVVDSVYLVDGAALLMADNGSWYLLRLYTNLGVTTLDVDQTPTTPPSGTIPEDIVFNVGGGRERLYLFQDTDGRIGFDHEPTILPGLDELALKSSDGNYYDVLMIEDSGLITVAVEQVPNP